MRFLFLGLLSAALGAGFGEAAWALSLQQPAFSWPEWPRPGFHLAGAALGLAGCGLQALAWRFALGLHPLWGARAGFWGALPGLAGWIWKLALRAPVPPPHHLPSRKLQIFLAALLLAGLGLSLLAGLAVFLRNRAALQSWTDGSLSLRLGGLSFAVYLLSGIWSAGWHLTGDAPHYLLMAHSLAYGGDLDLSDQYRRRDWLRFRERELLPQEAPRPDGRMYSEHKPLLPLMLALPYRALGLRGALWIQALLASACAAAFFLLLRRRGLDRFAALLGWAVFAFSAPGWVSSQLLLVELPAGALFLAALAGLELGGTAGWMAPLSAALLPWLGLRFYPTALSLALWCAADFWRAGRAGRAVKVILLFASSFAGALALNAAHFNGGPLAAYEEKQMGLSVLFQPWLAGRHLCGLLLDQEYGWLPFAPFSFLAFFGAWCGWRERRALFLGMSAMVLPYVALIASFPWWYGDLAPNRYLLCLWPFVALLAVEAAARLRWKSWVPLLALANLAWGWLMAVLPWLCYSKQDGRNWLLKIASSALGVDLSAPFPSFMTDKPSSYLWIAALAAAIAWYGWRQRRVWAPEVGRAH